MASGFSDFVSAQILDQIFNGVSPSYPTAMWVSLYTQTTAATNALKANSGFSGMEVSGGGYSRAAVLGASAITFSLASVGSTSSSGDILFPEATGTWGTISTVALMDASTNGNCIAYASLTVSKVVAAPDVFRIPAAQFVITL